MCPREQLTAAHQKTAQCSVQAPAVAVIPLQLFGKLHAGVQGGSTHLCRALLIAVAIFGSLSVVMLGSLLLPLWCWNLSSPAEL